LTPLNSIPGQEIVKKILLNSYNRDRLASTYLFYGTDGLGKWSMALALAALLNCEKPVADENGQVLDACGQCQNCRQILNCMFPELYFALPIPPHKNEAESMELNIAYRQEKHKEPYRIITSNRQLTIPIDTARAIKRNSAIKPDQGVKRVIVFYQMERMLAAAADSLLKLIEEPPPETIIILTAADPDSLLSTIQSRSQKIRFKPLSDDIICQYLTDKYDVLPDKANFIARLSQGSLGRAIGLIDDEDEFARRQLSFLLLKEMITNDTPSAVHAVTESVNPRDRGAMESILLNWQSFISDLVYVKYGKAEAGIINTDFTSELETLAVRINDNDCLSDIVEDLRELMLSLRRNIHIKPALAAFTFRMRRYMAQTA